jgi:hypothetical protein
MEKASSSLKEADSGVWVHVSLSYKQRLPLGHGAVSWIKIINCTNKLIIQSNLYFKYPL